MRHKIGSLRKDKEKYNEPELEALIKLNLSDESIRNITQYFESRFVRVNSVKTLCIPQVAQ